jgi:hypothetical protein
MLSRWAVFLGAISIFAPTVAASADGDPYWVEIRHRRGQSLRIACDKPDGRCRGDMAVTEGDGKINIHVEIQFSTGQMNIAFSRDGEWLFIYDRPYSAIPIGNFGTERQGFVLRESIPAGDGGVARQPVVRVPQKIVTELEVIVSPMR